MAFAEPERSLSADRSDSPAAREAASESAAPSRAEAQDSGSALKEPTSGVPAGEPEAPVGPAAEARVGADAPADEPEVSAGQAGPGADASAGGPDSPTAPPVEGEAGADVPAGELEAPVGSAGERDEGSAEPAAERHTQAAEPAAERPAQAAEPAAERHTQAAEPAAERHTQAAGAGEQRDGQPAQAAAEPAGEGDERQLERDLEELAAKAQKADEYLELAQRTRADFENYRRRAAREAAAAQERGVVKLVRELLPAVDNLDRALEAVKAAGDDRNGDLVSGIKLVHAELIAALARAGVERFDPAGERFDPARHEAVAQQQVEGAPAGTIVEVYQRGYRLGDAVIRPARVLVAG